MIYNIIDSCYTDIYILDNYEDKNPKYLYRVKSDVNELKTLIINDQKYDLFRKSARITSSDYIKELYYVPVKNIVEL